MSSVSTESGMLARLKLGLIGPRFEDSKKLTRRGLRCASSLNWVCLGLFLRQPYRPFLS